MLSRRQLLRDAAALTVASRTALAATNPFRRRPAPPPPPLSLYIGCDTEKGSSKGIYRVAFDVTTGHLGDPILAATTFRPVYLAFGPTLNGRRYLYASNEGNDQTSGITTFAVDHRSGDLRELSRVSSGFAGPCFVTVDATGRSVYIADYAGGGISSYRIQSDGTLSPPVERIDFHDTARFGSHGPNEERQDNPHPHCATLSPDNRFLVVNDLGTDQTTVFTVDSGTAQLTLGQTHQFSNGRPGTGPRHVAFHPNQRWLYSVNELDSTVDHYLWTTTHARESSQALLVNANRDPVKTTAPSLPSSQKNTAAEVAIAPNGYFAYVSNRGEDSLVVFSIDQASGALKPVQRISSGGKTPRQFTLDPTGRWLVCGNQDSANVSVFRRDGSSGQLTGPVATLTLDSPMVCTFA